MVDFKSSTIYALPLPSSSNLIRKSSTRKRKRSKVAQIEESDKSDSDIEYSAVITPDERVQRRLAGIPLNHPPPPAPFPHASQSRRPHTLDVKVSNKGDDLAPTISGPSSSLRNTHLAVMVTILHQSLEQKDYVRAAKAIAVILRTEISGRTIDIRHAGLWGIGAEILIRDRAVDGNISRNGFNKTKVFYDKLALQHPWHRSWPNVTNAQDFKLAMFDIWIYTVCMESRKIREQYVDEYEADISIDKELQAKRWELGEANTLSKEMDSLMGTVPFVDHLELIRLRAMVALWTADLIDAISLLSADAASDNSLQESTPYDTWSSHVGHLRDGKPVESNEKAIVCRNLAQRLFDKLGVRNDDTYVRAGREDDANMVY